MGYAARQFMLAGLLFSASLLVPSAPAYAQESCEDEDYICTAQLGDFTIVGCDPEDGDCYFCCTGYVNYCDFCWP